MKRLTVIALALAVACGSTTEPAKANLTGTWRDPLLPVSGPFVFVLLDHGGVIDGSASGAQVSYTLAGTFDQTAFRATLTTAGGTKVTFASSVLLPSDIGGYLDGGGYTRYPLMLHRQP